MSAMSAEESIARVPAVVTSSLVIVSVIFPVISIFSILLRYRARRIVRSQLGADDWLVLVAWVLMMSPKSLV